MRSDKTLLLDMLIAARKIHEFLNAVTEDQFKASALHQSAVLREIQVIGEAARLISDDIKSQNPKIPWALIAGMRNRVIHEYFRVDVQILWDTTQSSITDLIVQLQPLVASTDEVE